MKMAMELLDNIGDLTQLPEVHPIIKLIKLIVKAASTVRRNNRVCREFEQWLEMIECLLTPLLQVPNLMERPETCKPLKQLEESLQQAYLLVIKYKDRSYPYRFFMSSDIAKSFSNARNEINKYIDLLPLIKLFLDETISRVDEKEEEAQKKGKSKEEMDWKNRKNKEEGKNKDKDQGRDTEKGKSKEKKGKEENGKVKEKGRDKEKLKNREKKGKEQNDKERNKEKKELNEKEKERDREKDTGKERNKEKENGSEGKDEKKKKKSVPTHEETAVLKVSMHCECMGCPDRIKKSVCNYPGVKKKKVVVEVDKGIATVTVVGHFAAKTLRDYVAKDTKKEVHPVDNVGREREDHQALEKTGKDSKSIGGGGNKNKKRVVPEVVATVVLKVGGTGLRCDCNGCVDKICNTLLDIRGVQQVETDMDKSQVIVTGTTMDTETLLEKLRKKVRRPVEVVQPGMD